MGRAAKLKKQRKQQRLNELKLTADQSESVNLSNTEISQFVSNNEDSLLKHSSYPQLKYKVSDFTDWLLDKWSYAPYFMNNVSFSEAKQVAEEGFYILLNCLEENPHKNPLYTSKIGFNDRFTVGIFLNSKPLFIKSWVADDVEKHLFHIDDEFRFFPTKTSHMNRAARRRQEKELQTIQLVNPLSSTDTRSRQQKPKKLEALKFILEGPYLVHSSTTQIKQELSDLIDWLIEQWVNVCFFIQDFSYKQAEDIAEEGLYWLYDYLVEDPDVNPFYIEKISDRFTMQLYYDRKNFWIKTLLIDEIEQETFESDPYQLLYIQLEV